MFVLKQFLKQLILPPMVWMLPLFVVLIFWHRRWARKLLFLALCGILILHSGLFGYWLRYPPTIDEPMFRRLDEAWRLYKIQPRPIIVSGGHVNPFTPDQDENKIAREFLIRWGVPQHHVFGEAKSRDTFESAVETGKLLKQKGWKRYLLVTSALHMPRSMLAFSSEAPEPIPAPGDFTLREWKLSPLDFAPTVSAARAIALTLHEYIGLANYYSRIAFGEKS